VQHTYGKFSHAFDDGKENGGFEPAEAFDFAHVGVKEAVFPFNMFPEVDPVLGPEMKSTGEVLGIAESFGLAFWKAQEAVNALPTKELC
jgi:carbamoyl-phosphate synthase large subunit